MKRRHSLLAVFAVSCASATRVPESSANRLTSYSGTNCVEMALIRSVSPDALQALLPARYKLAPGPDGAGQLAFAIYTCDRLTLDASSADPGVVAEISARIQSPDGSEGRHAYLLHLLTSSRPLADALGRFGDVFRYAPVASFTVGPRTPGADNVARATIESDQGCVLDRGRSGEGTSGGARRLRRKGRHLLARDRARARQARLPRAEAPPAQYGCPHDEGRAHRPRSGELRRYGLRDGRLPPVRSESARDGRAAVTPS